MNTRGKVAFTSLALGTAVGILLVFFVSVVLGFIVGGATAVLFVVQVALAARSQRRQLGSPGSLAGPRSLSSPGSLGAPKRLR